MFETETWDDNDEQEQPHVSALTWAVAKSQSEQKQKKQKKNKSKEKQNLVENSRDEQNGLLKKSNKLKTKARRLGISVENQLDRLVNSPQATQKLLDSEDDNDEDESCDNKLKKKKKVVEKLKSTASVVTEAGKKIGRSLSDSSIKDPGYLLKLGEKFSSEGAFLRFVGLPGKIKKAKKRQRVESDNEDDSKNVEAEKNNVSKDSVGDTSENEKENKAESPTAPPRKKRKGLDKDKLRDILEKDENIDKGRAPETNKVNSIHKTLAEEARSKLTASRFRYLNEQLYTQPSNAAVKLFSSDSTLFSAYHQGYQHQAKQWPLDPLNVIITDLLRQDSKAIIADLGCGEARLSRSVPNTVHSFDLVAANDNVTVADIAKLPLEDASVDFVVFCLSLMGTNIRDFVFEAARILKVGGTLKIAELESRFQGEEMSVDQFVQNVEKFGFKNSWKDLKKDFFYFIDFQKVTDVKKKKKLPEFALKACLYKKR